MQTVNITKKWTKIINEIRTVADESPMTIKVGAGVIANGRLLHTGFNHNTRTKWHGIVMPSIHAEMHSTHQLAPFQRPRHYRRLWNSGAALTKETQQPVKERQQQTG